MAGPQLFLHLAWWWHPKQHLHGRTSARSWIPSNRLLFVFPPPKDPKMYVQTVLDVHKKYNALVMSAFNNDAGFVAALDKVGLSAAGWGGAGRGWWGREGGAWRGRGVGGWGGAWGVAVGGRRAL